MKQKNHFNRTIFLVIIFLLLLILISFLSFFSYKDKISKEYVKNYKLNTLDNKDSFTNATTIELIDCWQLSIPKINLISANIKQGTSQAVLKSYIGHFENTEFDKSNIGLAAHNRGYDVNYFSDIYKLEIGDEIIYKYKEKTYKYKVCLKKQIDSYDWSYLEPTPDNRITLITCIDNRPDLRLCVQAVEYEEENK